MSENIIEISNLEIHEYCILELDTGHKKYSKEKKNNGVYTGFYFRDEKTFFALYATAAGPFIYYKGKAYPIKRELTIDLVKNGKNRIFTIAEYGIEIHYTESRYINFDSYSPEENIDLFYRILIKYRTEKFYTWYTLLERNDG